MIILPSLEIVPAKYNTSTNTLLSQIPIDGTGDFTVTRATSATRVNGNGLIEVAKTNLALQSENFLTTWSPTGVTITTGSTADFTAPDGSTNASLLTSTSNITASSLSQNITVASGTSSLSVFAKVGNYGLFRIGNVLSSARAAWFNLDAGVVTGTVNGGTASMQNYGNGWYRCTFTPTTTVSGSNAFIIGISNAPNGTFGVSGSSIYFWGAQLEEGLSASEYIPTTTVARTRFAGVTVDGTAAANIPRLDYLQPDGTIGCPALLVEPAATNSFTNSVWAGGGSSPSGWSTPFSTGSSAPATSTLNPSVAAYLLTTSGTRIVFSQNISQTSGTVYTHSIYVEEVTGTLTVENLLNYNISIPGSTFREDGVVVLATHVIQSGKRYSLTITAPSAASNQVRIGNGASSNTTAAIRISSPQIETGSVATSYIPTTVSGVTRDADVITDTTASGVIGQTEGTMYAEVDIRNFTNGARIFVISDGTQANRIALLFNTTNRIRLLATVTSATQADISTAGNQPAGIYKIAVAYATNDYVLYVNGVQIGTDTTALVPACSSIFLGTLETGSGLSSLNDRIRAAALYTTRLTNTQLALLTSPYTSYSSMASALSYTLG